MIFPKKKSAASAETMLGTVPTVELHPRFVVVEDTGDPSVKLKERKEKSISVPVFGKPTTLISRENDDKKTSRWFKVDDDSSGSGKICFAKGVSPEIKGYALQVLLNQMDKKLMEDYYESRNDGDDTNSNAVGNDIHQKVRDLERQQNLDRTVFAIDTQCDEDIPMKKRGKKTKDEKESTSKDRRSGRTVFYVTVGQMKHTRIILKQRPDSEVTLKSR
jgi:hypothetical protein